MHPPRRSFGIVMWEVCARRLPYDDISGATGAGAGGAMTVYAALAARIRDGGRPTLELLPVGLPDQLRGVMVACWSGDPTARPTMHDVLDQISRWGAVGEGGGRGCGSGRRVCPRLPLQCWLAMLAFRLPCLRGGVRRAPSLTHRAAAPARRARCMHHLPTPPPPPCNPRPPACSLGTGQSVGALFYSPNPPMELTDAEYAWVPIVPAARRGGGGGAGGGDGESNAPQEAQFVESNAPMVDDGGGDGAGVAGGDGSPYVGPGFSPEDCSPGLALSEWGHTFTTTTSVYTLAVGAMSFSTGKGVWEFRVVRDTSR
jgi:hypothetical protein